MKKLVSTVTICAVVAMFAPSPLAIAGSPSKSGAAVAFAKVNLGTGNLVTFGGKGTKSASITDTDIGSYAEVTFTGKYPKDVTTDQIVINATCESDNYGVANAFAVSATSTQLVIGVYGWESDTQTYQGDRVFFTVFIGQ